MSPGDQAKLLLGEALTRSVRLSPAKAGIALVYHSVAEREGDQRRELLPPRSHQAFEAELRYVEQHFDIVTSATLPHAVATRRAGGAIPVAITFDDDLPSHLTVVGSVLKQLGVVATFFLTGAGLEGARAMWWERLQLAFDRGIEPRTDHLATPRNGRVGSRERSDDPRDGARSRGRSTR